MRLLLLAAVFLAAAPAGVGPLETLTAMEQAYEAVDGYTALLVRQERVDGELRPWEEVRVKYQRPGRIYLRWTAGQAAGREILFVPERDRILVREPGVPGSLFTLVMPPDHPRVLSESRHPVTDVGIGRLIELIATNARRALAYDEGRLVDGGPVEVGGRSGQVLELRLPPGRGYYCGRARVVIDRELGLPVDVAVFDWEDRLLGDYRYREIRLNPPFTALDFDPTNPEYSFPRLRMAL